MSVQNAWPDFMERAARPDAAETTFAALAVMVKDVIGTKLLTASSFDMKLNHMRRVYSDDVAAYPLAGLKPIPPGIWSDTVLHRKELLIRLTIEDISEVFFDWKLIQSLGCGSIVNIPIVVGGEAIGALNLLHDTGYYTEERLARIPEILPFAALTFLLTERADRAAS